MALYGSPSVLGWELENIAKVSIDVVCGALVASENTDSTGGNFFNSGCKVANYITMRRIIIVAGQTSGDN